MQAVILAGGLGTRLRPLTYEIPKPMIPINEKPYLEYQINYLRKQGVYEICILTGHLSHVIEAYFGNGHEFGVNITYSKEDRPMGTGGGLKLAEEKLADDFLLIYGDSFLPVNYQHLLSNFRSATPSALMCVYDNREDTDVKPNIAIEKSTGKILIYSKDVIDSALQYVDAGVLVLNKKIVQSIIAPSQVVSLEKDIFPQLIREGSMYAYQCQSRFYDIGTPDRLALAKEVLR